MCKEEAYERALAGKKIPILTLDNKWYKLFPNLNDYPKVMKLARSLNDLLKKQGKLNTETKDIKNLKKKLMQEIVPIADELEQNPNDKSLEKKLDELKMDWRGSVEYRVTNMNEVPNEEILLQSLRESYRSSINYRDSRREQ